MPEIKLPRDHVEIAVTEVEIKLIVMSKQLFGLMKAADISGEAALITLERLVQQKKDFELTGREYQAFQAVFDGLGAVRSAISKAITEIETARDRYTNTREQGELEKLLALFEAEDKKITE
jgi:hypothetical protein